LLNDRKTPVESGENIDVLLLSPTDRKSPGEKIDVVLLYPIYRG
jgi:hypothetical protein